jgi:hypothetical protein
VRLAAHGRRMNIRVGADSEPTNGYDLGPSHQPCGLLSGYLIVQCNGRHIILHYSAIYGIICLFSARSSSLRVVWPLGLSIAPPANTINTVRKGPREKKNVEDAMHSLISIPGICRMLSLSPASSIRRGVEQARLD